MKGQDRMLAVFDLEFFWDMIDRQAAAYEYMGEWKQVTTLYQFSSDLTRAWNRESDRLELERKDKDRCQYWS